jgi:hypothetical protein
MANYRPSIADPYNQRLAQIEESLKRSRRTLAQSQSYGGNTIPYYSNNLMASSNPRGTFLGDNNNYYGGRLNTTSRNNMVTARLVADVQQLEQQRNLLLEQSRLRNIEVGNIHRARAEQLRTEARYAAEVRAQENIRRQQEMQMRSHVYNTMSSLPTVMPAATTLPVLGGTMYDPYQARAQAVLAQAQWQARVQAEYELERQKQVLEYERSVQHNQMVQAMRIEADRIENERILLSAQRRKVAQAAAARGRSFQSKLADQQARTEAAAAAAAAASAERSAALSRQAYEQASMSDMRAMQLSAQLQRDRELFQVLTSNTLPGVDIDMYNESMDDLYLGPLYNSNSGSIYTHPWRPSNNRRNNHDGAEMSWRGRKVRVARSTMEEPVNVEIINEAEAIAKAKLPPAVKKNLLKRQQRKK